MIYRSKGTRLTEIFLGDLAGNRFAGEKYIPSSERLAKHYDASRNTIRRMLRQLESEGVLERQPNLRLTARLSVPAPLSASLRREVGWIYSGSSDNSIVQMALGIREYAEECGFLLRTFTDHRGHESTLKLLGSLPWEGLDGIILCNHPLPEYAAAVNRLADRNFPVVLIRDPGECRASSVRCDSFGGVFSAASHLIAACNTPLHYLDSPANTGERLRGFREAMRDAGYFKEAITNVHMLKSSLDRPESWEMSSKMQLPSQLLRHFLSRMEFPAGIVCGNDYIAYGVYEAAAELGLKVGRDLFVAGFDDMPFARRLTPPLSSVRVDHKQLGFQAAWLLEQLIEGKLPHPQHIVVNAELILRESTQTERTNS